MTASPFPDDEDRAKAVMHDLRPFLRKHRIGLFAREAERFRVAMSDPIGAQNKRAPIARQKVREWRDFGNAEIICSPECGEFPMLAGRSVRQMEILDALGQVMRHFQSAIIPAPVAGLPTMILCDGVMGNWRAYAVVEECDCYGYNVRGIRERRTN